MIPMHTMTRRRALRGMMGGAAVTVGLPLLDCFLNTNGNALADGRPLPVRFGNWVYGLSFNPGRWEPKKVGANYDMAANLECLAPFKNKINIYSGMKVFLDGKTNVAHQTGQEVCMGGAVPQGAEKYPSIDQIVADQIGRRTRFRSLEVAVDGSPRSPSTRGGSSSNPAITSPVDLYTRIFGPEFVDPNAADFTPDTRTMVRKSALSSVKDHRDQLIKKVGSGDRVRLDEYFTAVRELEQKLALELEKPAPLEACSVAKSPEESQSGSLITQASHTHKLFADLLVHALACDQTRVFTASGLGLGLRREGSANTYHIYTHEEATDPALGYQPNVDWFAMRVAECFRDMLTALDSIREGDGTILDHSLIYASTDVGLAKYHTLDNMPMMTAGGANGRVKTGLHVVAGGEPLTRVGYTAQVVMGVSANSWGGESNKTAKVISEIIA